MKEIPLLPIILCGGLGTRLWPLSRESYPKQFLSLDGNEDISLLQKTQKRLFELDSLLEPILVCNEEHRFIVAEQMREIGVKPQSIILEPFGKNTAPAITLASLKALEKYKNPIVLILSSDHIIKNNTQFIKVLQEGIKYADNNRLVTFGIVPSSPEIGYGYIKSKKPFLKDKIEGSEISKFIEKPPYDKAKEFLKDHHYTWNSGMFMFKAQAIIDELEQYSPEIIKRSKEAIDQGNYDLEFLRLNRESFSKCPNISIDNAIMEKTTRGTVLPLDVGWSDIGSWEAVWESSKKDINGNFTKGKVITESSKNCLIKSEHRLIVGIDIQNLVIVETNDAVLVADKSKTQKVKNIVKELKNKNIPEGQTHKKIYRPWGHYLSVVEESRWQVKLIKVKPGEKLSLQMHHHRSEHWIVVNGTAKVELDSKSTILSENESIYIPLGSKHRLFNPGKIPLILIEVQSGSYVGEDDIVRFEDKYGRSI
tara:strand:- start:1996 stop:3435 length:1440 start_codon:yes stop_codon:yes gene_type:complete